MVNLFPVRSIFATTAEVRLLPPSTLVRRSLGEGGFRVPRLPSEFALERRLTIIAALFLLLLSAIRNPKSEIATSATPSPSGHLRQSRDVASSPSTSSIMDS